MHEFQQELSRRRKAQKLEAFKIITPTSEDTKNQPKQPLISFKNVYFRYSDIDTFTISGINHESFYGDRILISGPSGSGKSTYVNLLTGMLYPSSGTIDISPDLLRNPPNVKPQSEEIRDLLINVCEHVPAKPFIFNQSLAYNIALRPDDEIDEPRLLECIKIVQLGSSLRDLSIYPDHASQILNTENISNGERQKIGIARALYGNPKILILDESLNSLDRKSSVQILSDISAKSSAWIIYLITLQLIVDDWATQQISFNDGNLNKTNHGFSDSE